MLALGWRSSASSKGTRQRPARAAPTVDFPEPETPMTTTGWSSGTSGRYPFLLAVRALVGDLAVERRDQVGALAVLVGGVDREPGTLGRDRVDAGVPGVGVLDPGADLL